MKTRSRLKQINCERMNVYIISAHRRTTKVMLHDSPVFVPYTSSDEAQKKEKCLFFHLLHTFYHCEVHRVDIFYWRLQYVRPEDPIATPPTLQFNSARLTPCAHLLFSLNLMRTTVMKAALNVNERGKPCSLVPEQRAPSGYRSATWQGAVTHFQLTGINEQCPFCWQAQCGSRQAALTVW